MARFGLAVVLCALAAAPVATTLAQDLLWARQAGTSAFDLGNAVAVDGAGSVYVTGQTSGSLYGPNAGGYDFFLAKYNASGTLLWAIQAGTSAADFAYGVAVDGSGHAYITGRTGGSLGGPNAGGYDAFLAKYDTSGDLLWTRQIGSAADDIALEVAVNGVGGASITGYTAGDLAGPSAGGIDGFLVKYDASGNLLWTRQFGTSADDTAVGVAVDGDGDAYISGYTVGSFGGINAGSADMFLAKYDAAGAPLWTRQAGSVDGDYGGSVAVDDTGNAYICGYTQGGLGGPNAGDFDAFLAKYDAAGPLLWTRQFGTPLADASFGVGVDGAGNVYLTGYTNGSLGGPNAGNSDLFVAKYDTLGTSLWTRQAGTTSIDIGSSMAVDRSGNAYVTGWTRGDLGGPNAGVNDVFLVKYGPPGCPSDFDGDGFVTGDDFDAYSVVFINGDEAADFDGNGFVNGEDFDGYVAAFEAGC